MKSKYKLIIGFLIILFIVSNAKSESVIYDNLSTSISNYKIIKVSSDLCISVLTDCKHEIYFDGQFLRYFKNGESIKIPDGSNISIVLDDPIKTNLGTQTYETGKVLFYIGIMYLLSGFFLIALIYVVVKKLGKR